MQAGELFGASWRPYQTDNKGRNLVSLLVIDFILIIAYILVFEYTCNMSDAIRRFKADVFQALGHPTRIAIVELLRHGPLPAGKLIKQLGIEQANVSQHLSVLRSKQVVINRKEGNQVFYSLRDPILSEVLDVMRRYFQAHLTETLATLGEIEKEEVAGR